MMEGFWSGELKSILFTENPLKTSVNINGPEKNLDSDQGIVFNRACIFDTGTTLMSVPNSDFLKIVEYFKKSTQHLNLQNLKISTSTNTSLLSFDCESVNFSDFPKLNFQFSKNVFLEIGPWDYISPMSYVRRSSTEKTTLETSGEDSTLTTNKLRYSNNLHRSRILESENLLKDVIVKNSLLNFRGRMVDEIDITSVSFHFLKKKILTKKLFRKNQQFAFFLEKISGVK